MRFVFTPPADHAAGLLTLPWAEPLADWHDERLVEIRQRGISRHVVRFVYDDGTLYALKELSERLARREYRLLRALADKSVPVVEAVGIAVDLRGAGPRYADADAILVTKFLTFSTTYRAVFTRPRSIQPVDGLLDALVELLVRLHLSGFFWGDCSLSNALFCYDAGTLEAYLVDAETSEQHPALSDGQRLYDLELAAERVAGELLDLQAGDLLPDNVDPFEIADELRKRYDSLWHELTREEILRPDEQRYRIAERLRRLNELGFEAEEVELIPTPEGNQLRVRTRVAESGHSARKLFLRTGIDAGENQARRLFNDIAGFRAYLEQKDGHPVSEIVAANRWLEEVYDPVIAAIPADLRGRLPPAEIFHEVLEHRWYMSEAAGRDVGTTAATKAYMKQVLPGAPEPLDETPLRGHQRVGEHVDASQVPGQVAAEVMAGDDRRGRVVGDLGLPSVRPDQHLERQVKGGKRGRDHDGGARGGAAEDHQRGLPQREPHPAGLGALVDDREDLQALGSQDAGELGDGVGHRAGAELGDDIGLVREHRSPSRRVGADEVGDHRAEPIARVLLEEVTGAFDHRVLEARRARDHALKDGRHTAGDRIPITERDQERLVPGGQPLPGGPVRLGRRVVRGRGDQAGHGPDRGGV
jgi:hypothetical protein